MGYPSVAWPALVFSEPRRLFQNSLALMIFIRLRHWVETSIFFLAALTSHHLLPLLLSTMISEYNQLLCDFHLPLLALYYHLYANWTQVQKNVLFFFPVWKCLWFLLRMHPCLFQAGLIIPLIWITASLPFTLQGLSPQVEFGLEYSLNQSWDPVKVYLCGSGRWLIHPWLIGRRKESTIIEGM